jgi:hypothetical protein
VRKQSHCEVVDGGSSQDYESQQSRDGGDVCGDRHLSKFAMFM